MHEKVKRSDAGEYEVELKNKAGKVNVPITLKVIGKKTLLNASKYFSWKPQLTSIQFC